MTHKYTITGMTCNSCVAKVKSELLKLPDVLSADVGLHPQGAEITMQKHISINVLQEAIGKSGKYTISEDPADRSLHETSNTHSASWLKTYKPLLLIFLFITGITFIAAINDGVLDTVKWMRMFMGGFFIVFSFFKFLDLKGFANSYTMYDLLAKKLRWYGFIYPFLELSLGLLYLLNFMPLETNIATALLMGFSSIGVIQTVLDKRQIKCACLGAVFNLPMSTVTIIEDLLMVVMAVLSAFTLL